MMLCGLEANLPGKGLVAGYDIARESEQVKRDSAMSQKFSLYEDLKVWENIHRLFGGILRHENGRNRRQNRLAAPYARLRTGT